MRIANRKLMPVVASALAFSLTFTGCVDNQPSDGVEALRNAQAALYNAQATAEITLADAAAAEALARAAMSNAQAQVTEATIAGVAADSRVKEINAEIKELELLLAQANSEKDIAEVQLEIEVMELEKQAEIAEKQKALAEAENALAIAALNAEKALAEADKDLAIALDLYEKEIRLANDNNALLYYEAYETALASVRTTANEIADKELALANDLLTLASFDTLTLLDEDGDVDSVDLERDIENYNLKIAALNNVILGLEEDKVNTEAKITVLNEVLATEGADAATAIAAAMVDYTAIKTALEAKEREFDTVDKTADELSQDATEAGQVSTEAATVASAFKTDEYDVMVELVEDGPADIDSMQTEIDKETVEYDLAKDATQTVEDDKELAKHNLDVAKAELDEYLDNNGLRSDDLDATRDAYYEADLDLKTKQAELATLEQTLAMAEAVYAADGSTANETARDNAEQAVDDKNDEISDAQDVFDDALGPYTTAVSQLIASNNQVEGYRDVVLDADTVYTGLVADARDENNALIILTIKLDEKQVVLDEFTTAYTDAVVDYAAGTTYDAWKALVADADVAADAAIEATEISTAAAKVATDVNTEVTNLTADLEIQNDFIEALEGNVTDIEDEIKALVEDIDGDGSLWNEGINGAIEEAKDAIAALEKNIADANEDIANNVNERTRFEAMIADQEARLAELAILLDAKQQLADEAKVDLDAALNALAE